jgi:hypothetical protein
MKTIAIPSLIKSIRTLTDGGISISIHTNELPDDQMLEVMKLANKFGWFGFKENDYNFDLPNANAYREGKTPSQRLYGKMFKYFVNKFGKENKHKFNEWYEKQIEMIIDQYENKTRDLI